MRRNLHVLATLCLALALGLAVPIASGTEVAPGVETAAARGSVPLCFGRVPTIVGTDGDDDLVGTDGSDVIVGLRGDDVIDGGAGRDFICGGPGVDEIHGGLGGDKLRGNGGGDIIYGDGGTDRLFGNRGWDLLIGGRKFDVANGGANGDGCEAELLKKCEGPVGPPTTIPGQCGDVVIQVGADGSTFTPQVVEVPVFKTVCWEWQSGPHSTTRTGPGQTWDSGVKSSGTFVIIIEGIDVLEYFDSVNPAMTGTIDVSP